VKIDSAKSVSAPLAKGHEVVPVSDGRVSHNLVSHQRANASLPALELGQELEGMVVEELGGGRLLLKVGATLIEAEGPGELGAGQHLRLRVEQLQPQVLLHVTEIEPTLDAEAARLLRAHLPAHADSAELLDSLQHKLAAVLDPLSAGGPTAEKLTRLRDSIDTLLVGKRPLTSEKLQSLARDGGLFYEAKLFSAAANEGEQLLKIGDVDLKGLLLSALEESGASAFSTGLQNALRAQLDNIETQQAVNLLAQLDGGAFQLQIPFFTGAGFSTAVLALEPDGHGPDGGSGTGKNGYSVLFMLDLENFGRTRIDAYVAGKELRAVFFVDNGESLQIIRQELSGFRETLLALGYSNIQVTAKPLRDLPADKQEKFAALAAGSRSSIHLLDMKA
jgi:hypothetical protein